MLQSPNHSHGRALRSAPSKVRAWTMRLFAWIFGASFSMSFFLEWVGTP